MQQLHARAVKSRAMQIENQEGLLLKDVIGIDQLNQELNDSREINS